ncbi:phosphoglycolate phosphatase [soil metagenome]
MSIRAVMFDFDGTLADSFGAITASTNHVRGRFDLPPLTEAEVKHFVGFGLNNLLDRLVPGVDPAKAMALYRDHHPTVMLTETRLFPGVRVTLTALQARGIGMAVCSNKSVHFTKQLVEGMGLSPFFAAVLGPEDVSAPKPDPAMLLEGAKRLKVSTEVCAYVGDMIVDVETAKAAGIPVWIVPFGVLDRDGMAGAKPDRMLTTFEEILTLV